MQSFPGRGRLRRQRAMEAIDALVTEILGLGAFHSLEGRGQGWVREAHSLSNSERRE